MRVRFWGVRGAIASPGANTLRYGGNTSCVAVESANGELIVLDVGSGFCPLGDTLMNGPFGRGEGKMTVLLSHIHMDHLIGFPFAVPVHIRGNIFTIYGPTSSRMGLAELHEGLVAPAYSPVYTLDNIGATLVFRKIPTGPFRVGDVQIEALRFPHFEAGFSWGFKLSNQDRTLVYVPDVHHQNGSVRSTALKFVQGVDLLVHDAFFTAADYSPVRGQSQSQTAVMLALSAGVKRLVLFHHSPDRSDDQIDALVAEHRDELHTKRLQLRVDAAYEGMTINL